MAEPKKTPLYDIYGKYGGRTIDFAGWYMPVQYSSIKEEHRACREKAALWDVSNMGQIMLSGPGALDFLQFVMANDISKGYPGRVIYTPMCNPQGGVVDDLMVMCLPDDRYLLVVNASNIDKDYAWIAGAAAYFADVKVENQSDETAGLALQGPNAVRILQKVCDYPLGEMKYYHGAEDALVGGVKTLLTRTGYTGEDGFELYVAAKDGIPLFELLLEAGKEDGLIPAGLGCRDTLRFEAGMPLYGHELAEDRGPLEAGLGKFVAFDKDQYFVGARALMEQRKKGLGRKLVGLEMIERGVPRTDYKVFTSEGQEVGFVSTGSFAPTLDKNLAMAYVPVEHSAIGTPLSVEIRGKKVAAQVVKRPFYKREAKKR